MMNHPNEDEDDSSIKERIRGRENAEREREWLPLTKKLSEKFEILRGKCNFLKLNYGKNYEYSKLREKNDVKFYIIN